MRKTLGLAALAAVLACGGANAQQVSVKVGVLSDMSSLYSDIGGAGSVAAAKLAIADFTKDNPNVKVELISGDHQNKPDIGSQIANQWYDVDKVDHDHRHAELRRGAGGEPKSPTPRIRCSSCRGAAASDLTGAKCNANTIHWTYDTWMLANGTGNALVKTGGDTWFFLTSDYAFGHALERDTMAAVEKAGGKVLGKVRHPINTNDSLIVPAAGAVVQGQGHRPRQCRRRHDQLDQAGSRIRHRQGRAEVRRLAGVCRATSTRSALQTAQGLTLTETWYWDTNDTNRDWTKRWQAERNATSKFPTMVQAGVYSGLTHYLKARGGLEKRCLTARRSWRKMKQMPTDDPLFGKGTIRPGRPQACIRLICSR